LTAAALEPATSHGGVAPGRWELMSEALVYFAFLIQRPHDAKPWPVNWQSLELAEAEPDRVSEIATVYFKVADDPSA